MNYICYLTYFSLIDFKYHTIAFFISEGEIEKLVRSGPTSVRIWETERNQFLKEKQCASRLLFLGGRCEYFHLPRTWEGKWYKYIIKGTVRVVMLQR